MSYPMYGPAHSPQLPHRDYVTVLAATALLSPSLRLEIYLILLALSGSTTLHSLTCSSEVNMDAERGVSRIVRNASQETHFYSLQKLQIRVAKCRTISPLLPRLLHLQVIRSLGVDMTNEPKSLFDVISQCSALRVLEVAFRDQQGLSRTVGFGDLEAILACNYVTEFTLRSAYPVNQSDSDITRMALAWPRLQKLDLGWRHVRQDLAMRKISLWAVFLLTHLCPHLQVVRLYINTKPRSTPTFDSTSLPLHFRDSPRSASLDVVGLGFSMNFE
ncbi:hypothetical protein D9758_007368 [Tetrapyrgos nigripes]|uniref:Uncharacterized protein n=1 Tax=Tetrapyrgos nigripes TaxID=182062 RepID=A0A8H5LLI8_9AGAR|nr:hypothetical protein D9758_007368 [Tetrapyrgos nigripes]